MLRGHLFVLIDNPTRDLVYYYQWPRQQEPLNDWPYDSDPLHVTRWRTRRPSPIDQVDTGCPSNYQIKSSQLTLIREPAGDCLLSCWTPRPGPRGDLWATGESPHSRSCPPSPAATAGSPGRNRRRSPGRAGTTRTPARPRSEGRLVNIGNFYEVFLGIISPY